MTTWSDLIVHIKQNYKIKDETPGAITMLFDMGNMRSQFDMGNMRSQFAIVSFSTLESSQGVEEWVRIESPVAKLGEMDIVRVLTEMSDVVCGAVALNGEW